MTTDLGRKITARERLGAGVELRPRIHLTKSSAKVHIAGEENGELEI